MKITKIISKVFEITLTFLLVFWIILLIRNTIQVIGLNIVESVGLFF